MSVSNLIVCIHYLGPSHYLFGPLFSMFDWQSLGKPYTLVGTSARANRDIATLAVPQPRILSALIRGDAVFRARESAHTLVVSRLFQSYPCQATTLDLSLLVPLKLPLSPPFYLTPLPAPK